MLFRSLSGHRNGPTMGGRVGVNVRGQVRNRIGGRDRGDFTCDPNDVLDRHAAQWAAVRNLPG